MNILNKTLFSTMWFRQYHYKQNRAAYLVLRDLKRHGHSLNRSVRKQIDEYAITAFGSSVFAPWLYVYTSCRGSFIEGWIPDNYYGSIVCPTINKSLSNASRFRSFARLMTNDDCIPDLGYIINGRYFNQNFKHLPFSQIKEMLFNNATVIYFKSDESNRGTGVRKINSENFDESTVFRLPDGVFQEAILQHEKFDDFDVRAVTTIRLTTVLTMDCKAQVRAAYVRFGDGQEAFVQSRNHIRVAVKIESGELDAVGYLPDWRRTLYHPNNKTMFEGFIIPEFENMKKKCMLLHEKIPHAGCIGWDVCVDRKRNIKILEWNTWHNDIKFSEAITGPCFMHLGWEEIRRKFAIETTVQPHATRRGA